MTPSRIAVVSGAYYQDPAEYRHLTRSAELVGAPLTLIGVGMPYPEFGLVRDIREHLRQRTEEYVLVTDAGDTMFVRWNEQEIINEIDRQLSGLFVSTETGCWPTGPWCDAYNGGRAINGGQYCGRRTEVIKMLERLDEFTDECGGTWQERMHKLYATGYPIGLDLTPTLFLSMSGPSLSSFDIPQMLHFNGRTKGIQYWFDSFFGVPA